eukprot:TRINITY_DN49776_c0_g1_i1.p1 TRINITY_DN49776_c0_g1~~TRINITY_DN49776_c0_g1_i1.p1  ORF type:complete len:483 (+),score=113.67 TRINITY_DN49776_c0_g1_i1:228-1676(+)
MAFQTLNSPCADAHSPIVAMPWMQQQAFQTAMMAAPSLPAMAMPQVPNHTDTVYAPAMWPVVPGCANRIEIGDTLGGSIENQSGGNVPMPTLLEKPLKSPGFGSKMGGGGGNSPQPQAGNGRSSKGPISKLQEFVQSSKAYPLPSSCPVLQWSHENRMVGSSLHFRATTAFLLDGVPHHVLGGWWPSKKQAQRDAAERALGFFIGRYGEELAKGPLGSPSRSQAGSSPFRSPSSRLLGSFDQETSEVQMLEEYCGAQPPRWNCRWEATGEEGEALCQATVEVEYIGAPHVFAGRRCSTKDAARNDTARRVLWYLQVPGYESAFQADHDLVKSMAQEIPEPVVGAWPPSGAVSNGLARTPTPSTAHASDNDSSPGDCLSPSDCSLCPSPQSVSQKTDHAALERKTVVMRLQNRLQKIFAKQLTPGKSVWSWRYERDQDGHFKASVHIALLDKSFSGGWAEGHQAAQMEACQELFAFLDKEYKQ